MRIDIAGAGELRLMVSSVETDGATDAGILDLAFDGDICDGPLPSGANQEFLGVNGAGFCAGKREVPIEGDLLESLAERPIGGGEIAQGRDKPIGALVPRAGADFTAGCLEGGIERLTMERFVVKRAGLQIERGLQARRGHRAAA